MCGRNPCTIHSSEVPRLEQTLRRRQARQGALFPKVLNLGGEEPGSPGWDGTMRESIWPIDAMCCFFASKFRAMDMDNISHCWMLDAEL